MQTKINKKQANIDNLKVILFVMLPIHTKNYSQQSIYKLGIAITSLYKLFS